MFRARTHLAAAIALAAALVVAFALAAPGVAKSDKGAHNVRGEFSNLPAGDGRGYDISGPVRLQVKKGETTVRANVKGLDANETYASHLHEAACDDGMGGGHYMDDPSGPAAPPNELWLSYETNAAGNAHDSSSAPWVVRDGARSVVIHDNTDGARLACADLPVG